MGRTRTVRKKPAPQFEPVPNDARERAEVLKKDFEAELANRFIRMQEENDRLLDKMKRLYTKAMYDVPKKIRDMKLTDYLAELENDTKGVDDRRRTSFGLPSLPDMPPPSKTKPGPPSKQSTTSKNGTRRGSKAIAATPAGASGSGMSNQWPIITPKYNPKRGMTPLSSIRRPKNHEITWSAKGSPVSSGTGNRKKLDKTLDRPVVAKLENAVGDLHDVLDHNNEDLDEEAMQYMAGLHSKLTQMLNKK